MLVMLKVNFSSHIECQGNCILNDNILHFTLQLIYSSVNISNLKHNVWYWPFYHYTQLLLFKFTIVKLEQHITQHISNKRL